MLERDLTVVNPLGLHARAAAKIVKCSNTYDCFISVSNPKRGIIANGRSILELLTLGGSVGVALTISVEGKEEEKAMAGISELFESGFGEV